MRIELMFLDHILTKKLDQLLNHNGSYTPSQIRQLGKSCCPSRRVKLIPLLAVLPGRRTELILAA